MIIQEKADILYLTHYGKSTDVLNHISEMKNILKNWADWIKEKKSRYDNIEDLTNAFNDYVYDYLKNKHRLDENLIDQYYAANPPYMSVSGLIRYWEKSN